MEKNPHILKKLKKLKKNNEKRVHKKYKEIIIYEKHGN